MFGWLGNADGIFLVLVVGTELGSLYRSFDGSNYDKLDNLLLRGSTWSSDGKNLGSDKGFILGYTDGKVLGT